MILDTLSCTISDAGISKPAYSDVYETLQSNFKAIYGSDAYIDADSQDGQMLAVIARAIDDANDVAVAVYNSFSPATAQGRALSNNVKINGISRDVATNSSAPLRVVGQVGTTINKGIASDSASNRWLLPDVVVIPPAGQIDVTAFAEDGGAITAATGTITQIETPTLGWQTVTNTGPAVSGAPVEPDATLRKRQAVSVALPSRTVLDGLQGALLGLLGVTQARVYENDTNLTDGNGILAHTIAAVTVGGINTDIANAILLKKTPGCGTQGTTSVSVTSPAGIPTTVKYYPATPKRVVATISGTALPGYVTATGDLVKQAITDYINGLGIGKKVDIGRLFVPAQLNFGAGSETFEINSIQTAFFGGTPAGADLLVAFNEIATMAVADITLTIT
jgi:uncharacterized phage protein gp47/JayE